MPAVDGVFQGDVMLYGLYVRGALADYVHIARANEQRFGGGVVDHKGKLIGAGAEVEGDIYGVELGGGEVCLDVLVAVGLQHCHAVSGLDAQGG